LLLPSVESCAKFFGEKLSLLAPCLCYLTIRRVQQAE
jgi:hypothetical protein